MNMKTLQQGDIQETSRHMATKGERPWGLNNGTRGVLGECSTVTRPISTVTGQEFKLKLSESHYQEFNNNYMVLGVYCSIAKIMQFD